MSAWLLAACGGGSSTENVDLGCLAIDEDEDGWPSCFDCDDNDPNVFPGAEEIPNDGIDQSCSGSDLTIHEGTTGMAGSGSDHRDPWIDEDGDGWPLFADCDDTNPTIFPGAKEIPYDGIDQNCDGADWDDLDFDGYPGGPNGTDCDDGRTDINPGALEIPLDGVDQNCDGSDLAGTDVFVPVPSEDAEPEGGLALAAGTTSSGDVQVLAVWSDSRNAPKQDIYGRFVDERGEPVGDEFPVAVGGAAKSNVRIASKGDGYLVAWDDSGGVWAQRVSLQGDLQGPALGIGSPGTSQSQVAWGGANWALIWKSPEEGLQARGVSTDGVRGDKEVVADIDPGATITLAGGALGFLVAWDGAGIQGRRLNALGEPVGTAFLISTEPHVAAPSAASDGGSYFVAFRRGAGSFSARGKFVDLDGYVESPAASLRLGRDALAVTDLSVTATNGGFFTTWNDGRHLTTAPPHGGIYGNIVSTDDDEVLWPGGAALHVDVTASLSGSAFVGETLLVASRIGGVRGVVPWARLWQ